MNDKAAATAEAPKTETVAKDKGPVTPRPRKHDYGIADENTIVRVPLGKNEKGEDIVPNVKADVAADYELTAGTPTVAKYFADGGSRHGLRVLSRRKLINIKGTDGTMYPKDYVAPPPKPPAEKKPAAAKKVAAKKTADTAATGPAKPAKPVGPTK